VGILGAQVFAVAIRAAGQSSTIAAALLAIGLGLLIALVLITLAGGLERDLKIWLVGSYGVLAAFAIQFAKITDKRGLLYALASPRYFYVPGVIFLFMLIANVGSAYASHRTARSVVSGLALGVALFMG